MGIRKVDRPTVNNKWGRNINDVCEFIKSGWDCAEVELDGRDARKVAVALNGAIKQHDISGVSVRQRKGHIYLVLDEPDDGDAGGC